ncbi:EamA family transporter [Candidatus Berkiella aquae]|uniref:DMT family transporter n=1 Tax=Candidatus Berkiella aquae TaxID=295108 RepID=A0A0Q9YLR4_9GAMM|nr:DMT family transporter [Candidatus Berkiella aquae]MCS5711613.1 DMT family transporter [Candidatus Berkiella aquae]
MSFSSETQGALLALFSGLLYGLVGYFGVKLIDLDFSIAGMQFWRFFISAITVGFVLIYQNNTIKESKTVLFKTFTLGGLFYSVSAGIYFVACQYIGTGPSMVVFFTYPAFVMLINWILFKQAMPKIYFLAICLIILGMSLLVDMSEFKADALGIAIAVLSGICYAGYIVSSKNLKVSPIISTLMVSLGCATACLVYALWDKNFSLPTSYQQWAYIVAFGTITTAIPMLLFLEGLKRISSEKASILSVSEPVFVVIFGIVLLEESIELPKVVGIATILSGAILTLFANAIKEHVVYKRLIKLFT